MQLKCELTKSASTKTVLYYTNVYNQGQGRHRWNYGDVYIVPIVYMYS